MSGGRGGRSSGRAMEEATREMARQSLSPREMCPDPVDSLHLSSQRTEDLARLPCVRRQIWRTDGRGRPMVKKATSALNVLTIIMQTRGELVGHFCDKSATCGR